MIWFYKVDFSNVDKNKEVMKNYFYTMILLVIVGVFKAEAQIEVWPGDANNDGTVDMIDFITIGMVYDTDGYEREDMDDEEIFWQAYEGDEWGDELPNGEDIGHADCNGDSWIGYDDVEFVVLFFDEVHSRSIQENNAAGFPLQVEMVEDSVSAGDTATIQITLGNLMNPVTDMYGLSFSLSMNPAVAQFEFDEAIDMVNFDFDEDSLPSFEPMDEEILELVLIDPNDGLIRYGMVRTDHVDMDHSGTLTSFKAVIEDDLDGVMKKEDFDITFQDVNLVSSDGVEKEVNAINTSLIVSGITIDTVSSVKEHNQSFDVQLYPNPSNGILYWKNDGAEITKIEMVNVLGEKVLTDIPIDYKIDLNELSDGIYFIKMSTSEKDYLRKIVLRR